MSEVKFDVIVIGSGPSGEEATIGLLKHGKTVAVVEQYKKVGGACTHLGTIPSKVIRFEVNEMIKYYHNSFQKNEKICYPNFFEILQQTKKVIKKQVNFRKKFYKHDKCKIFYGVASFIDENTLKISYKNGNSNILRAETIIIATGSRPYCPPNVDFFHSRIYNSDSILSLNHKIRSIIIYGAGFIGCEYASIFRGIGIKVDLINTRNNLLSFLDREISDSLSNHFQNMGICVRNNEEYTKIKGIDRGVIVYLKSGKILRSDCLLYANGRTGNTNSLNLNKISISSDRRGLIEVNSNYRTCKKNIYAIGDVIGNPSLASAAYNQGWIVSNSIVTGINNMYLTKNIPAGIYTIPEISFVGKTEQQLISMKIPYEVGRAQFKNLAKAQISGINIGELKILFHRETLKILGIHCFGDQATEIIHIGQTIMEQKGTANNINYFVNITFNYPTMAEAFRVAALNGLNRIPKKN